jgi:hypothetical protein
VGNAQVGGQDGAGKQFSVLVTGPADTTAAARIAIAMVSFFMWVSSFCR